MDTVKEIRNNLIDKILTIKNKKFLLALDDLISSSSIDDDTLNLSEAQIEMLKMSEEDIKYGRLITQEQMDKENLEWLNNL